MTMTTISDKAMNYLIEGRVHVVQVDENSGSFEVKGTSDDPYVVVFAGQWVCTCPARVPVCAHVVACQTISKFDTTKRIHFTGEDEASEFFRKLI